jgi:pimeloyl-ACP methyl ester carboxylesterase
VLKEGLIMGHYENLSEKIKYKSTADGTMQPAVYLDPDIPGKKPLLVALHTWSMDSNHVSWKNYARWCASEGWVMIHPDFRGPNWTPQAMGSELVIQDIKDAVDYARVRSNIDIERIYLAGGSGGGYASLLMAGRASEIWAGVSAWCPISDLKKWYSQCVDAGLGYAEHIEAALGGKVPGKSSEADDECMKRSALPHLPRALGINVDISTGIHDGHTGSVPVSHTLEAFNALAAPEDRLSDHDIEFMVSEEAIPGRLRKDYGLLECTGREILFRKTSGNARCTIFEGGHELMYASALNWLARQRKGFTAEWLIDNALGPEFQDSGNKAPE